MDNISKSNPITQYFTQKMQLLTECVSLSEEFLSHLDDWESLDDILSRREAIISKLQALEHTFGPEATNACSEEEKRTMNQKVDLLLKMDQEAARYLKEEQEKLLVSMKSNHMEQKIANYGASLVSSSSNRLDYKK